MRAGQFADDADPLFVGDGVTVTPACEGDGCCPSLDETRFSVAIPQPHRPVVAGGCQHGVTGPVDTERDRVDPARVTGQRTPAWLPSTGIPQPHRPVVAGAGQRRRRRDGAVVGSRYWG